MREISNAPHSRPFSLVRSRALENKVTSPRPFGKLRASPVATPLLSERGKRILLTVFIGMQFICFSQASAVQIHHVTKNGRQIQLDGFLLEWKKADAKRLGGDSAWLWDAINTGEGLTGYFTSGKTPRCGPWTFRFLTQNLSLHKSMDLRTDEAAPRSFYRTAQKQDGAENDVTTEWIIPWDSIWHDSSGAYQVGLFAFDTCGDTVQPLILSGHVYLPQAPSWGGVYGKAIMVGVLLVLLFMVQRRAKAIQRKKTA
jgi:hypothetical protein